VTVQLSQPDFNRLTRIVQNLPDFASECDRTGLVAEALANVPQVNSILARLDLDGSGDGCFCRSRQLFISVWTSD